MINKIKALLGLVPVDYKALFKAGAQIIDVRTRGEYNSGHIPGSANIPLNELQQNMQRIRKDKPVITCCASGMRSASAKGMLKANGYEEVYNGGGWLSLQSKIKGG